MIEKIKNLKEGLENFKVRSKWSKAIKEDSLDLIDWLERENVDLSRVESEGLEKVLLNGARNWQEYSYGGSALIYDSEIAEHYCTPSELKKCKGGLNSPNRQESWIDVQARGLWQSMQLIKRVNSSLHLEIKM